MRTQTFGALRVVGSVIVVINLIVCANLLLVISVMFDISFLKSRGILILLFYSCNKNPLKSFHYPPTTTSWLLAFKAF